MTQSRGPKELSMVAGCYRMEGYHSDDEYSSNHKFSTFFTDKKGEKGRVQYLC